MLATAQLLNLAVRFAVEIALLTAVATAAWHVPSAPALRWAAAGVAVLAVSVLWVRTVHHDGLPAPVRLLAQAAALVLGTGCLLWLDAPSAAAALTVVALLNVALLAAWDQQPHNGRDQRHDQHQHCKPRRAEHCAVTADRGRGRRLRRRLARRSGPRADSARP